MIDEKMADLVRYRASELEQARTADLLRVLPKGRATVLDIGARDGHFSKLLAERFNSVTALDLEKPKFQHPGVVTVAGDVIRLEFPDNAFDCVFCAEVLEHISDIERACIEICRVARREIVIGVPFKQDLRVGRTTCGTCGNVSPPWGHVNSFDEGRLFELFAGCRLVSKSFVGETKEATNLLAAALSDLAGNPWGAYDEDCLCCCCGASLRAPASHRTLGSKMCSVTAHRLDQLQALWTRPHGIWIHVVFSKP